MPHERNQQKPRPWACSRQKARGREWQVAMVAGRGRASGWGLPGSVLTTPGSHRGLAAEVDVLPVTRWLRPLGPWAWALGADRVAIAEERLKAIVAGRRGSGWRREDLSEVKTARPAHVVDTAGISCWVSRRQAERQLRNPGAASVPLCCVDTTQLADLTPLLCLARARAGSWATGDGGRAWPSDKAAFSVASVP